MANWCMNTVTFSGDDNNLKQLKNLLKEMARKCRKTQLGQIPDFVAKENTHFFDISLTQNKICYVTKWSPNNEVLKQIADHFKLDFVNNYDELANGIFGEAIYKNGILLDVSLDLPDFQLYHYDKDLESYVFEGNTYEQEWDIFLKLLDAKKRQLAANQIPDISEEAAKALLFKTISQITKVELSALYGDMMPADIILKLAEHKNFDAARAEFQTWDERFIIEMDNFLIQDYRHESELYTTRDKYIAMSFLKELINEWDFNRRDQSRNRLGDPVQQQKATELLALRLTGKLPHITIAGADFTVDWRLRELRETAAPWNRIDINNLRESESGEEYLGLYNTEEKRLYHVDNAMTVLPENVVHLGVPNEIKLDPVAVAREYGIDINQFVRENPIMETLTAVILPISETGLPELVQENLKKATDTREGLGFDQERKIGR